jgi:PAS domain S-box-containing protein
VRLNAQIAQLKDRLDRAAKNGSSALGNGETSASPLLLLQETALAAMSDVVLVTDDAGRLTYVSPNVQLIFGHSHEDVIRQGRIGFLLPANLFDPDALESRGEISNLECRIRDSVGRSRDLLASVKRVSLGGGTRMFTCRDVTERRRIETELDFLKISLDRKVEERTQELRESREQYRRLVEGLRDEYCFYSVAPDGTITYVSPSIHNILGYTPEQCIGRNWRDFVDPQSDSYANADAIEAKRRTGLPASLYEMEVKHANGEDRVFEVRDVSIFDDKGKYVLTEGICKDVTAKRAAEAALQRAHADAERLVEQRTAQLRAAYDQLRDSEIRYRSAVEDNPDFIVRWRGEGLLTFVNDAYCQHMGKDREALLDTSFMASIVAEDLEELERRLAAVSKDASLVVYEHRVTLPSGQVVWHRWSHRGLFDAEARLTEFQSVGSDITNRRAAEEHARDKAVAEAKINVLTARERDVMRCVVAGDANKVIARKLDLSIKTIEKHRSSLMRKLRVRSVPELVRLAMLAGLDAAAV